MWAYDGVYGVRKHYSCNNCTSHKRFSSTFVTEFIIVFQCIIVQRYQPDYALLSCRRIPQANFINISSSPNCIWQSPIQYQIPASLSVRSSRKVVARDSGFSVFCPTRTVRCSVFFNFILVRLNVYGRTWTHQKSKRYARQKVRKRTTNNRSNFTREACS